MTPDTTTIDLLAETCDPLSIGNHCTFDGPVLDPWDIRDIQRVSKRQEHHIACAVKRGVAAEDRVADLEKQLSALATPGEWRYPEKGELPVDGALIEVVVVVGNEEQFYYARFLAEKTIRWRYPIATTKPSPDHAATIAENEQLKIDLENAKVIIRDTRGNGTQQPPVAATDEEAIERIVREVYCDSPPNRSGEAFLRDTIRKYFPRPTVPPVSTAWHEPGEVPLSPFVILNTGGDGTPAIYAPTLRAFICRDGGILNLADVDDGWRYATLPLAAPETCGKCVELADEVKRLEKELDQESSAHLETIDGRDDAEEAISKAYLAAIGSRPEWSNMFGHDDAVEQIECSITQFQKKFAELTRLQSHPPQMIDWSDVEAELTVVRRIQADEYRRGQIQGMNFAIRNAKLVPVPSDSAAVGLLRDALKRIAAGRGCGCNPCRGQCRSETALMAWIEEAQEIAQSALSAQPMPESIPCQKCAGFIQTLQLQNKELAEHRERIDLLTAKSRGEYWAWEGDGNDHLESLTCPVLIRANDLRELLKPATESVGTRFEGFAIEDEGVWIFSPQRQVDHDQPAVLMVYPWVQDPRKMDRIRQSIIPAAPQEPVAEQDSESYCPRCGSKFCDHIEDKAECNRECNGCGTRWTHAEAAIEQTITETPEHFRLIDRATGDVAETIAKEQSVEPVPDVWLPEPKSGILIGKQWFYADGSRIVDHGKTIGAYIPNPFGAYILVGQYNSPEAAARALYSAKCSPWHPRPTVEPMATPQTTEASVEPVEMLPEIPNGVWWDADKTGFFGACDWMRDSGDYPAFRAKWHPHRSRFPTSPEEARVTDPAPPRRWGIPLEVPRSTEAANPADNLTRGLYRKYEVSRTDGSDKPGGKHDGCQYFVLDLTHDPHARPAIKAYLESCREKYPYLATDLNLWLSTNPAKPAEQPSATPAETDVMKSVELLAKDEYEAWVAQKIGGEAFGPVGRHLVSAPQYCNCNEDEEPCRVLVAFAKDDVQTKKQKETLDPSS